MYIYMYIYIYIYVYIYKYIYIYTNIYTYIQELMACIPADYIEDDYEERIQAQGGFEIPLNIFLYQELQRFQAAIYKVRTTLDIVAQAIRGEVVVTAEIMESINAVNIHIYINIYMYIYISIYTCVYSFIYIHIHICIYIYIYI
jgi:hypothetical protein